MTNGTLTLRKVLTSDLEAVREYREEFLVHGDSMDGCSNLRQFEDMADWFIWIRNAERPETCPAGWVPDTQFLCVRNSDGRIVGMLDIRHELNDTLLNFHGHIGYSVRASERRKGYAKAMLAMAKDICLSMGLEKILITCEKENSASAKTILCNGGILENEIFYEQDNCTVQRYWITL